MSRSFDNNRCSRQREQQQVGQTKETLDVPAYKFAKSIILDKHIFVYCHQLMWEN